MPRSFLTQRLLADLLEAQPRDRCDPDLARAERRRQARRPDAADRLPAADLDLARLARDDAERVGRRIEGTALEADPIADRGRIVRDHEWEHGAAVALRHREE